jgi:hypothetical protein
MTAQSWDDLAISPRLFFLTFDELRSAAHADHAAVLKLFAEIL